MGHRAVTMEIPVPLAKFPVRKMGENIVVQLFIPSFIVAVLSFSGRLPILNLFYHTGEFISIVFLNFGVLNIDIIYSK